MAVGVEGLKKSDVRAHLLTYGFERYCSPIQAWYDLWVGAAADLLNRLICRLVGHRWIRHEGGHVHAGDDWNGEWRHGHPWTRGVRVCWRCDRQEAL